MLEYLFIFIAGVFIGNFVTTLLYRLPRGVILYGFNKATTQPPFCSSCKHVLEFYEYLPIISWLSTRGSCNYCKQPITQFYFLLEMVGGVSAVLCALLYGDNIEIFIIMFCFYNISVLALLISYEHDVALKEVTASLLFVGILYRTLNDNSILPWCTSLSFASIASLYILKNELHNRSRQEVVHIILPASIWLSFFWNIAFAFVVGIIFISKGASFYRKNLYIFLLFVTAQELDLFTIYSE